MVNGCRVLAARDPLAAVIHWLPCHWVRVPLGARATGCACHAGAMPPGRADGDRATLTVTPQTIYFFSKNLKYQVANGFYLPVLQSFSSVC
jgi:hypothetical protein